MSHSFLIDILCSLARFDQLNTKWRNLILFKSSVIWPLGGTLLMVTISRLRNVSGIISPLTTRSSRIKYLLTQMYELLRTKEKNDIFTLDRVHDRHTDSHNLLQLKMLNVSTGQYFHLTHVNYDDENMTLFTQINMCDTLCDMLSIGPSMAPPACCCCC